MEKKIEDGKYPYSRFCEEDIEMYWEILEELPYDPALEQFFLEEGETDRRMKKADRRHIAPIPLDFLDIFQSAPSAEDGYFLEERNEKLRSAMETLTPVQYDRTHGVFFGEKSLMEIAEEESVSEGAVRHSVERAIRQLRKQYEED